MTLSVEPYGCTIRPARADDLRALVSLCLAHAAYERVPFVEDEQEERLGRSLFDSSPRAWCLVVEMQRALVGYATWSLEFSTWRAAEYVLIDCLYLEPAYRGRGLGRAMMARIAGRAASAGVTHLEWQTPVWNAPAVRFYERLGARGDAKIRFSWRPESRFAVPPTAGEES